LWAWAALVRKANDTPFLRGLLAFYGVRRFETTLEKQEKYDLRINRRIKK